MLIRKDVLEKVVAHAKREAPIEACGYLALREGVVVRHFEMTNTDRRRDHFTLDPQEQFRVHREARAEGLEIGAVYHSHPLTPARPSAEDIRLAADPRLTYLIVSLAGGASDVKAYRIRGSEVAMEYLEIVGDDRL